ncbi:MAG TPA: hypothetical protein VFF60_05845 [Candidatus Binatus sp.]|nr:hypothetical protein [Candidatus Binatus sp.]
MRAFFLAEVFNPMNQVDPREDTQSPAGADECNCPFGCRCDHDNQ